MTTNVQEVHQGHYGLLVGSVNSEGGTPQQQRTKQK